MGLSFRAVAADTGAIGGSASHEFQVIAETGEDAIAFCPDSDFAANIELAEAVPLLAERAAPLESLEKTATPDCTKCESVAALLGLPLERTVKSLVLAVDKREPVKDGMEDGAASARIIETRICLLLVRGDHELNEVKAGKVPGLDGFRFATETEIVEHFGCVPGYIGPVSIPRHVRVIADRTVALMRDFVCGANDAGFHFTGANWERDCPEPEVADLRNVRAGDPSPDGRGTLEIQRGIEVGHVFYLGTKYSDAMNARFVDEDGQSKPFEMGCYGIGVTRLLGAAIEQNHDERGIIWPAAIAPFEVVITPLGMDRSDAVREQAESIYRQLTGAGLDVILDDRGERPGAMFADWELIGVPVRVTVGERGLKEGVIEVQSRRAKDPLKVAPGEVLESVHALLGTTRSLRQAPCPGS
jgi:prolyl-tRNA synthetase